MSPEQLLYAESHEWVHVEEKDADKIATIGISAHAVEALTDLVYMDLPAVGATVTSGEPFGEVESVKATSELYSPVDGEVIEANTELPDNLEILGTDPYIAGWIIKVKLSNVDAIGKLMDHTAYEKMCCDS
ncbi:MAG: glycine cleavage system protein GcvH [Mariniblastus sp.]|nr:glycine cleavage system protein GcvH [Mariniblastus sp.]